MSFNIKIYKGEEHYTLEAISRCGFDFWLSNEKREGISLTCEDLYNIFEEYFKKNF